MKKKILIIGHVWPEPKSSAAGGRMMQLIRAFQKENYEVLFASACAKSDNAFDLSLIQVVQVSIILNDSSFDDFIKGLNPDVVMFDRFMTEEQFGWRVAQNIPGALRLLDTEDLHSLRKGRQQALKENQLFDKNYLFNDIAKREIASIYRCDLSFIISEAEMSILTSEFKVPENLLLYLPFMLELVSEDVKEYLPAFNARQHFVTIGNFLHAPNWDGVLHLKQNIWPQIRQQLPMAELHIYGAYKSPKVSQLHSERDKFLVKGFAENVNDVMASAKVCLAPLRFGAGLKGKLVDAMQNGTPCMMSSIAAEGMFGDLEPNGFIEDDPNHFARQAVTLYANQNLWETKSACGFEALKKRFNESHAQDGLFKRIEDLTTELTSHRENNFTGQMLHHHLLQSTKYMSKWIEEKNKHSSLPN